MKRILPFQSAVFRGSGCLIHDFGKSVSLVVNLNNVCSHATAPPNMKNMLKLLNR
jgi:hypothetical protein